MGNIFVKKPQDFTGGSSNSFLPLKTQRRKLGDYQRQHLKKGCFVEPTIITDVTTSMQIWREEVFGPVLCVKTFSSDDEAIELANDTQYGLGVAVLSKYLKRCETVIKLQYYLVNCLGQLLTTMRLPSSLERHKALRFWSELGEWASGHSSLQGSIF